MNLITARCLQGQIEGVCHILSPHGRAELPRDDVAAVVVQNRAEVEPAPPQNLEIGKVGLPQLVDRRCLVLELVCSFQHDERRAGDQVQPSLRQLGYAVVAKQEVLSPSASQNVKAAQSEGYAY